MPEITVVVPVYGVEAYLSRCVSSILEQTYSNFELILTDDGSYDGSAAICDRCAVDSNIIVVHQRNGGLSAARNVGIDWAVMCSDSRWLAFVDSDDWVHPRYLEYLLRAATENGVEVAACDYYEADTYAAPGELTYEDENLSWEELFLNNSSRAVVAWNKLYAKGLFEGLRYPVGRIHEDEFLTYRLLHRAGFVAYVPLPLYSYFQNNNGITKSRFSISCLDEVDARAELVTYVHKLGLSGLYAWAARSYFFVCIENSRQLMDADWIPEEVRRRETKRLKVQARWVLFRYGLSSLSLRADYGCYLFVFPHLARLVRMPMALLKKAGRHE